MATIGTIKFENDAPIALIAGPCVIEEITLATADRLKNETAARKMPFVFKASFDKANRQSLSSARGPGIAAGLEMLREIKKLLQLPVLTDIHLPEEADQVADVVDCIQIPAFLCRQTDIIRAAAETGRAINIKKGQFLAPAQMLSIVEKARGFGATEILVTERGASFGYNDLVFDPRSLEIMKEMAAVVFDASHSVQRPGAAPGGSGGDRKFIPALSRAAVAVGIAGIFIETHPDPAKALSDRQTQWPLNEIATLLDSIIAIDKAVKHA